MGSVVVLGSANLDYVVRAARLPGAGETVAGESFGTVPGGKGLNQAVAAHRAGADVAMLGALGEDAAGRELAAFIAEEGLDAAGMVVVPGPTGSAHITVQPSGENSIVVVPGANGAVLPLDATRIERIAAADVLLMQLEVPQAVLVEGARYAKSQGALTILTPAPVQPISPELLAATDVLVPNEHEARQLAEAADVETAARTLSAGRTVLVTLGGAGVLIARDGELLERVPARRVQAVDTTAAGDTFVGALAARIAEGVGIAEAVAWAQASAALSVTRTGATASMPMRAEVDALLTGS